MAQAGHATGVWISFASSGGSASQCCTYFPVWGHLNKICRAMRGNIPCTSRSEIRMLRAKTGHSSSPRPVAVSFGLLVRRFKFVGEKVPIGISRVAKLTRPFQCFGSFRTGCQMLGILKSLNCFRIQIAANTGRDGQRSRMFHPPRMRKTIYSVLG